MAKTPDEMMSAVSASLAERIHRWYHQRRSAVVINPSMSYPADFLHGG